MSMIRAAAGAAALALLGAPAHAADPVEGLWMVQDGSAKIHVAPCATDKARMCGKITWLKDGPLKDANNPDASLRGRPLVGLLMIRDFKASSPGKWTGGKIYDPGSGKTYDSKLTATSSGLKVEGCVSVICKAYTWKKTS